MNEKVKELAEKAGFVDYTVHNRLESKEIVLDNFARLIIEESIKILHRNDYHGEWLGEKIKEHFGIE